MRKELLLWVRFCTELKQTVSNSWYVKTMVAAGWSKRAFPFPGTAQFRIIDLFLAMTVN